MKWKHYIRRGLRPLYHADICISKKDAFLQVYDVSDGGWMLIFALKCKDEAEAVEIMHGFVHGLEYTGVYWEQVD